MKAGSLRISCPESTNRVVLDITANDEPPIRIVKHGEKEPPAAINAAEATSEAAQPSASPAKDWQMPTKEAVDELMARLREAMQATASPTYGKPAATIQPAEPTRTQAEIQALTKPDDESWFEAIDAVCEKIGIYGACRAFLIVIGAGSAVATIMWVANQ